MVFILLMSINSSTVSINSLGTEMEKSSNVVNVVTVGSVVFNATVFVEIRVTI